MKVNERKVEDLFDSKLNDLYGGPYGIKSNDILLGYVAAILFEYRHGIDTRHLFRKLLKLRESGYISFSPSLKSTISIYLTHGGRSWAEFLTQGHLDGGEGRVGRPPGIYRLSDSAREEILAWKKKKDRRFYTFLKAHDLVRKEVL